MRPKLAGGFGTGDGADEGGALGNGDGVVGIEDGFGDGGFDRPGPALEVSELSWFVEIGLDDPTAGIALAGRLRMRLLPEVTASAGCGDGDWRPVLREWSTECEVSMVQAVPLSMRWGW